ncbi:MAG: tRNA-dihydrouridine synthase family protein [Candidatus Lernaella stagnicola]|nr:tRNA-dihydrouridine synthase family protein [Candidatus Lernaella stagnicola]
MRIGSVLLPGSIPLVLAPLAGYSDAALRMVCRDFGADLTVTEMASADALALSKPGSKGFRKTMSLLASAAEDHPVAAQLFGKREELFAEACRRVAGESDVDLIDLNAGCPVRKVVKSGHGVALMGDPALLGRIVEAMKSASPLPLMVKLRSGFDRVNVVECARICREAGADALTVHPRTRAQMFGGTADWSLIAAVKDAVDIPVIGNGDVTQGADAAQLAAQTGCDAVMIGRAALQRPWIFAAARAALDDQPPPPELDGLAKYRLLERQVGMLVRFKGEARAAREIRKYALFVIKGFRGAAAARRQIVTAPDIESMLAEVAAVLMQEAEKPHEDDA